MLMIGVVFLSMIEAATPVYAAFNKRYLDPGQITYSVIVWMTWNLPVPPSLWTIILNGGGFLPDSVCSRCHTTMPWAQH